MKSINKSAVSSLKTVPQLQRKNDLEDEGNIGICV